VSHRTSIEPAPRGARLACVLGSALLLACSAGFPSSARDVRTREPARSSVARTPTSPESDAAEIRSLEGLVRVDGRARLPLAQAHFRVAQRALESGDERGYTRDLARAQRYLLDYIERNPRDAIAQNQLGILAAYRGDFSGSRRSFRIATQLDPRDPIAQLNLAELAVYEGEFGEAQRRLELARRRGADPVEAQLIETLLYWKKRDLVEAKARFEQAHSSGPDRVRHWNGSSRIETFEDMAAHCCRLLFCGPYMAQACGDMNQAVARQQLEEATVLQELRLEMERTRRVREIYERQRDLDIRVDDSADESSERGSTPRPSAPAP